VGDPQRQTSHVGTRSGVKHTQMGDRDPSHNRRSIDDSERAHENNVSGRRVMRAKRHDMMPTNKITHKEIERYSVGGKVNLRERDNAGARPFVQKCTTTKISSSQGTGTATRTPTPTNEVARARILDLTMISQWTLITTGLRMFAKGLLNVETLKIHFHRTPPFPPLHIEPFLRLRSRRVVCGGGRGGLLTAAPW
jgi:hypothetical protein